MDISKASKVCQCYKTLGSTLILSPFIGIKEIEKYITNGYDVFLLTHNELEHPSLCERVKRKIELSNLDVSVIHCKEAYELRKYKGIVPNDWIKKVKKYAVEEQERKKEKGKATN